MISEQTILVVEDEDGVRLSIRDYLRLKGYRVLVASDGVGAIKKLLDNDIDAVVTDYRMNGFGGEYWLRFLRSFFPDLRVIVTSGYVGEDDVDALPLLAKPFDYDVLAGYLSEPVLS